MSGTLDEKWLKAMVIASWKRGGMDSLVKVVRRGHVFRAGDFVGYCTAFKFVVGRTSMEMEHILGIKPNTKLLNGADIYIVDPLPAEDQFELRAYTNLPDGYPIDDQHPCDNRYPPGAGAPQWRVLAMPQSCLTLLGSIAAGDAFQYPIAALSMHAKGSL